MNILELTFWVGAGSFAGGFLGSLTGLGGGMVVIPLLTLVLGVDIRYAAGASLVAVIATSSGSASAYVKEGFTNMRIGVFLEVATSVGAVLGASLVTQIPVPALAVLFGCFLLYSSFTSLQPQTDKTNSDKTNPWAVRLKLNGSYPSLTGNKDYHVQDVFKGFSVMGLAGVFSGLLGVGSGALKVLAMDRIMKMPFKVSTTTSNFMIGVTAAASAGIYLRNGYIDPGLSMPVMLGAVLGSVAGTKILVKLRGNVLRIVFAVMIGFLALEMLFKGFAGKV